MIFSLPNPHSGLSLKKKLLCVTTFLVWSINFEVLFFTWDLKKNYSLRWSRRGSCGWHDHDPRGSHGHRSRSRSPLHSRIQLRIGEHTVCPISRGQFWMLSYYMKKKSFLGHTVSTVQGVLYVQKVLSLISLTHYGSVNKGHFFSVVMLGIKGEKKGMDSSYHILKPYQTLKIWPFCP